MILRYFFVSEHKMETVKDYFGSLVFNDKVMRETLSEDVYRSLKKTINEGAELDISVANAVASAMKEWAISKGATHYTHWFQPLTGITAEKHDSFVSPDGEDGIIMDFSGSELIMGEPDASSLPSGGLRATFEARGYTAWDPTSYAFIKGKTLCIPTAFCSYGGEALDQKTPLLRSMEALNKQALRILRLFGHRDVKRVWPDVGAEQEYFLLDRDMYKKRTDLVISGRTLFGAKPPKGQEMDDHYFGAIKPRVAEYMEDLNRELWKLGIMAKTEHNETAPSQHELAPVYSKANVAIDHNQLTMEIMGTVARRHGLVCLLNEKPFEGVNGSGKHNNWSISTDTGINLLSPGATPYENAQFLLFLCAVMKAVDDYQDLLRISVATAGNDHRLGASEAPPAIISMYLGDELSAVLKAFETDEVYHSEEQSFIRLGVDSLPDLPKDSTDRNRTSPLAFTGNKFEFRMPGSAGSLASANIMLNTAVAESLRIYADYLEKADDFEEALHGLVKHTVEEHGRILFSGNGYDEAWVKEAIKRGLSNYPTTADCLPHLLDRKNVEMFARHGVYTERELRSRCEILLENYSKTEIIEANTMTLIARREILPAIEKFADDLSNTAMHKSELVPGLECLYEKQAVSKLSGLTDRIFGAVVTLEKAVNEEGDCSCNSGKAEIVRDRVLPAMRELRNACDEAESIVGSNCWPFPTYSELLYSVD